MRQTKEEHEEHVLHVEHVKHVKHVEHVKHVLHVEHAEHVLHVEHVKHVLHVLHVEHVELHVELPGHTLKVGGTWETGQVSWCCGASPALPCRVSRRSARRRATWGSRSCRGWCCWGQALLHRGCGWRPVCTHQAADPSLRCEASRRAIPVLTVSPFHPGCDTSVLHDQPPRCIAVSYSPPSAHPTAHLSQCVSRTASLTVSRTVSPTVSRRRCAATGGCRR